MGVAVREHVQDPNRRTLEFRFANARWRTIDDGLSMFEGDGQIGRRCEYYNPVIAANAYGAPLDSIPVQ